jgi:hypothetical protein
MFEFIRSHNDRAARVGDERSSDFEADAVVPLAA